MTNWLMVGTILGLFVIIMIIFSQEKLDYVAYALIISIIACILTTIAYGTTFNEFMEFIEFEPLIFIFSMQIIILITEKHKIFQWVAVKTLHLTKGNHRAFFYFICIVSTISAAIIADVTVAIIFIPLVIRACRILKIQSAPYLFGITITINIGSIITPFSSSENILIATSFNLGFSWFATNLIPFSLFAMIVTLFLLDRMMLSKQAPPDDLQKRVLLEIMDPNLVIINKKKFIKNSIYFMLIILGFIVLSRYAYLIALIGAVLMSLLNRTEISDNIARIDWKLIFFFISLFLLIGCMQINQTFQEIQNILLKINIERNLLIAIGVLIIVSFLSGFLANTPTAIVGIQVLTNLYGLQQIPDIILIAFLLAINLGGNLLPQGAACDVMTLNIAKQNKVEGFTYKTLFKRGGMFALIHIGLCIIYLLIYHFISLMF